MNKPNNGSGSPGAGLDYQKLVTPSEDIWGDLVRLPVETLEAHRVSATAQDAVNQAKDEVDLVLADESEKMRASATMSGDKLTEKAIALALPANKRVQEANEKYRQASLDFSTSRGLLAALDRKNNALTLLAQRDIAILKVEGVTSGLADKGATAQRETARRSGMAVRRG